MSAVLPGVAGVWSQVEPYADAWHAHNLATLIRPGRSLVVLGDSMAQGVGATSHETGWVGQLANRLAGSGVDVDVGALDLSATEARVDDVLTQQLPALDGIGSRADDVVIVMVGSNDLFGGRVQQERLPQAYAALVERVPAGTLVCTLPQPTAAAGWANVHVARAAASGRIVMVDLRETGPSSWRGRLAGDFFHPSDGGYAAMADAVEPAVRAAAQRPPGR